VDDTPNLFILWLTQFALLVGLFGLLVPIFPGLLIMWLAVLGYGVVNGFSTLGIVLFIIITILVIAGSLLDNVMMGAGARQGGASWKSILVAIVAGLIGTLAFPPFGGFIAAPLAVFLFEYIRVRDWKLARQAMFGLATGWGLSFVIRFLTGLLAMGLWWLWVWKG
jgi:uncharacterized protein